MNRSGLTTVSPTRAVALPWGALAPWLLLLAVLLLLFYDTAAAMVAIWSRSDTFAHAYLVPPISLWLAWQLRTSLAGTPLRPSPLWLVPMTLACLLWLLGSLANVNAATQFAFVAMLVTSVPLVLGTAVARRLMFPLAFLFFCVPMGEFLIPPMMEGTADFTVLALRLSGIPVYREGLQFVIPSGNWSVVEACSGVRYLIASLMVGALFAYLNFRSLWRRWLFLAISIAVPVVANWLRAYMIVMLGHYSGNTIAVGADHLLYGWVFFGVVILLIFAVGGRFSDLPRGSSAAALSSPAPSAPLPPSTSPVRPAAVLRGRWTTTAAAAAAAMLVLTVALLQRLEGPSAGAPPQLSLPAELPGGWVAGDPPASDWKPRFQNPSAVAAQTYRSGTAVVAIWIGFYRGQSGERKLVTTTNALVDQGSQEWLQARVGARTLPVGGELVPFKTALLRTPADPKAAAKQRLHVLQLYRIDGGLLASDARARLRQATTRLLGRGDDGAVLMFYGPIGEDGQGVEDIERFAAQHLLRFAAVVDAATADRSGSSPASPIRSTHPSSPTP